MAQKREDEYSEIERRIVRSLLPDDEQAVVRLSRAVEGFLRFRGSGSQLPRDPRIHGRGEGILGRCSGLNAP